MLNQNQILKEASNGKNWTSKLSETKEKAPIILLDEFEKKKNLITLKGITTSQINQALKADHPYPARVFLKVAEKPKDIPIFFRIKENQQWIRPKIKTGSYLQVAGIYNSSVKSPRPSFTAYHYQLITQ